MCKPELEANASMRYVTLEGGPSEKYGDQQYTEDIERSTIEVEITSCDMRSDIFRALRYKAN